MAETPLTDPSINCPRWLTKDFVRKILVDNFENDSDIIVHDLFVQPAVGKGENFASCMLRVRVDYTLRSGRAKQVKLIVKTQLQGGSTNNASIEEINSFGLEIHAYEDVVSKVHELLRSIGDDTQLTARLVKGFVTSEMMSDYLFDYT